MHQAHDLRVDGRFGYFIGELGYYFYLVTERSLQPGQEVLAVVVVLIEYADLGGRLVLQDVLPEGFPLHLEARIHRHGPGEVLRIGETPATGRDEDVRHLGAVQIFLDRDIGRRADGTDIGQHPVILDQFSGLFDRLRRTERVVERDQVVHAAVDAAGLVDHFEIAGHHAAVAGERRSRPAIGDGLPALHLVLAAAGPVFLLLPRYL